MSVGPQRLASLHVGCADCLAVVLEPGSPFTFFEHPFALRPWSAHKAWKGSHVLQVQRDGDAHAAWKFFDVQGVFTHWYVNFQEPLLRHVTAGGGGAFETADLGIDIVFPPDGSHWEWKDVDDPAAMLASGRISHIEHDRIRAETGSVAARLHAGTRWSPWDDWRLGEPSPEPAACRG